MSGTNNESLFVVDKSSQQPKLISLSIHHMNRGSLPVKALRDSLRGFGPSQRLALRVQERPIGLLSFSFIETAPSEHIETP